MVDEDRPRGFLTPDDRDYIRNGREYGTRQQHSNKRRTIRERIVNGIQDFTTLQQFDQAQKRRIFSQVEYGSDLHHGITHMVGFAYRAIEEGPISLGFPRVIEDGVGEALVERNLVDEDDDPHAMLDGVVDDIPASAAETLINEQPTVPSEKEGVPIRVVDDIRAEVEFTYRDPYDPRWLRQRFMDEEDLSDEELGQLVRGVLGHDEELWEQFEHRYKPGRDSE